MGKAMTKAVLAAAFAAALGLAACSGGSGGEPPAGAIALSDAFSSDFSLVDETGKSVSSKDFRGEPLLVYFGYTHCPDVCPASLAVMSAALNELGDDAGKIQPLFITVDPERDTPEQMKTFLSFDDRILGLTGTPEQAAAARDSFKVYASKHEEPGSAAGYTMDHVSLFYFVDRKGTPVFALRDKVTPHDLAQAARSIIR